MATLPSTADLLATAIDAASAGGAIIRRYAGANLPMRSKRPSDFVSDADVESEAAIIAQIKSRFPDHAVLGEESHTEADLNGGRPVPDHHWIIDPLDGTTNFAHRIDHIAVSIAYYYQGRPIVGVVENPIRGERFSAVAGGGAFENGRPLQVVDQSSLDQALVGVGFYYDRGVMMEATLAAIGDFFRQNIHGVRRFGTAALDLCYVASGRFGAFFEYTLSPWDFAAGRLIVAEAGGIVTDARGATLGLEKSSVLAAAPGLHAAARAITARHHPDADPVSPPDALDDGGIPPFLL